MSNPKISIITPSYNQGQYIEETILSIINQNYPYVEHIIIDGGSTDNTVDVLKKYNEKLTYWVSEKDNGQSEALNKGLRKATGEIIYWLNSDDILLPDALNKVVQYFDNNKDIDFLNGYMLVIDKKSNILFSYFVLKQKRFYAERGIYYIAQPSMFFKRKIFDTIGFLKEDYHAQMDKELLIRIFENNFKIGEMKKFLAAFRYHEASKSIISGSIWNEDTLKLRKKYPKSYGQKPKIFYRIIYGLEKLIKGMYFKRWEFNRQWKGKNLSSLKCSNSTYLN